jgi:CRP-like cAMP-binding protein
MKETDKLSLFFSNEFPFNKEGLDEFVNTFVIKSYKKGEIILENGNIDNELRFLDQGIIREYYATADKEKNINFFTDAGFITDFSSFTNQYNCGKLFVENIFQRIVVNKETEEFNHFVNTAEELYQDIMKSKPDWLLKIPQYHIASYLGITPETLSRIRKRI